MIQGNVTNWSTDETGKQFRKSALRELQKIKKARRGKKFQLIRVDAKTWIEKEIPT